MKPYTPTEIDTTWLTNVLNVIRDDGILCYPSTFLIYKVSHANKTTKLMNPLTLKFNQESAETHRRHIEVAKAIGWTTIEERKCK